MGASYAVLSRCLLEHIEPSSDNVHSRTVVLKRGGNHKANTCDMYQVSETRHLEACGLYLCLRQ